MAAARFGVERKKKQRARVIGQWGPAVSGTRARERGAGDRRRGASGDGAGWAAARVAGWLGRLAPGPPGLASARFFFVFNRQTKVKRTKIIKTIYRHNIYKNVQKNIS